jgi:NAD(P)H-hydrate epimerase
MECAGRSVVDELERQQPGLSKGRAVIFCGRGNNGGDGSVVGRHLAARGGKPEVILFSDPAQLKGDALTNWEIARSVGFPVHVAATAGERRALLRRLDRPPVIVDALFGTGLSKPIGPDFQGIVAWINNSGDKSYVVSVDIPSGLFADSPSVPGPAVEANLTVTFTALKLALVVPPAADLAGKVKVAVIGSPAFLLDNPEYKIELAEAGQVRRVLPRRPRDSHKGHYGHVFVVAGSRGKSGAALMAGMAALRSGAGLVTLALPESLRHDVIGKFPELMTEFFPETAAGTLDAAGTSLLLKGLPQYDTLVMGPGLSTNPSTRTLIRDVVHEAAIPVVLDADGINAFAGKPGALRNRGGYPVIITPHPGEMARLLGVSIASVQKQRLDLAIRCASDNGCFTILKGFQTVCATPDGRAFINPTGNPGMATGGSGDILAGMAGRFVAGWWHRFRGVDAFSLADYLVAAVYLHGLAGDLAAGEQGEECLIATDLLPHLPEAFRRVANA